MRFRAHPRSIRTFMVRALSFSAVTALTLNPFLTPVLASDYRATAPVAADGQMNARFLALGIGKSVVIDLPRDIKDVLVARPFRNRTCPPASDRSFRSTSWEMSC